MKIKFLETVKVLDGEVCHPLYHELRVRAVLNHYGVVEEWKLFDNDAQFPSQGLFRYRIVYTLEGVVSRTLYPYEKKPLSSLRVMYDDTIVYDKKYEDRAALEHLYAQRQECDDILIVKNGYVTDTTIANIACYKDGRWFTPHKPLLEGTTRSRLLTEGFLEEEKIDMDFLLSSEKLALMNAMIDFDIIATENIRGIMC